MRGENQDSTPVGIKKRNRKTVVRNCPNCGKEFHARIDKIRAGSPKPFCSLSCSTSYHNKKRLGDLNPSWKGGISSNNYHYKKLQVERYPERVVARQKIYYEIKAGRIKREPCEVCGDLKTQGHHKDYQRPLMVTWLCQKHHHLVHNQEVSL
ncbi:MAG: hypothetical protein WC332_00170 [Clostridia bacterium]|jgi:ribosomal protein S27AE